MTKSTIDESVAQELKEVGADVRAICELHKSLLQHCQTLSRRLGYDDLYICQKVLPLNRRESLNSARLQKWFDQESGFIATNIRCDILKTQAQKERAALIDRLGLSEEDLSILRDGDV